VKLVLSQILRVFENGTPRKIFGPKTEDVTGGIEKTT
jgi:hypothetical protein